MKRLTALIAATLLLVGTCASAANAYEPWKVPEQKPGTFQLAIDDLPGQMASVLQAVNVKTMSERICAELGAGTCKTAAGWIARGDIQLGVCEGTEVNCIESITVYKEGEEPTVATKTLQVPGPTTLAKPSANIPRGSTTSVWTAAGQPNSSGAETYAAWASLSFHLFGTKAGFEIFKAGVTPVEEVNDSRAQEVEVRETKSGSITRVGFSGMRQGCLYNYTGRCGVAKNFSPDTRVSMSLRMTSALTGWLTGRLANPDIEITAYSPGVNLITVDASPVEVPMLAAQFARADFPNALKSKKAYANAWNGYKDTPSNYSSGLGFFSDTADGLMVVEDSRKGVKDTATGVRSTWMFSSIFRPDNSANECLKDKTKVLGLVTTNAMAYEGGAPDFKSGFLQYQVAGMHYLPDRRVARGTYDLVIRSSVARCLYGFTDAPVSASFAISGGTNREVATTTVSETDGWLKLSANNFTFSKKTIKIKLTGTKKK